MARRSFRALGDVPSFGSKAALDCTVRNFSEITAQSSSSILHLMRVTAAVLLAALTVACQDPEVPKYELNPGGPTVQIPTTLKLTALSGTGATARPSRTRCA